MNAIADTLIDFRRLADDLPLFLWTQRPDGTVDWLNRPAIEYFGVPSLVMPEAWRGLIHPDDARVFFIVASRAWRYSAGYEIEVRVKPYGTDEHAYRWFLVRSTPRRNADDSISYWLGTAVDIHDARMRGAERAESFRVVADGIPEILWTACPDGGRDWYNERWYEYTGQTAEEAAGWGWAMVNHRDDLEHVIERWNASVASGEPFEVEARIRRHDGEYRWFLTRASAVRDANGAIVRWCGTSVDIDDARRALAREQLYAELTEKLTGALSLEETLRVVTRLVVPEFADYVLINLLDEDGEYTCAAAYHRNGARRPDVEALIGTRFLARNGRMAGQALYSRVPLDLPEKALRRECLPVFQRLGLESLLVVPLTYRGRIVGQVDVVMAGSGRAFTPADMPLFEELARRISPAIGNAEAYERERRVARTFQDAALEPALPAIPGLRFDAIYEAAHADATIGGDWYDAFRLPDGRVVLSIGDVAGSGLDAAVTMGSVRQSIRTASLINPEPVAVLDAVDRIVRAMGKERFVTAFVAVLDPVTFELTFASAGHPPPLLRTPDGSVTRLGHGELPLGLRQRAEASASAIAIEPGSVLVAYTDGLTEFDRDALAGERVVIDALRAMPTGCIAREIHHRVTQGRPARDDVAILAVSFDRPLPAIRGPFGATQWIFETDDAETARRTRLAYDDRLRELGLSSEEVSSAELVFGELLGNVVRYAPGTVEMTLDVSCEAPVLHVLDNGEGFEMSPRLPADPLSERGRGLYLIRALAEELSVERRRNGGSHARVVLAGRTRERGVSSLSRNAVL
jgi:PAS domain S-box-containing protein